MGDPQGYEELIPCADGRLFGTVSYCMRPCIYMVDLARAGKAQLYYWKAEVIVLGFNAQVWRQDTQVSARGKGI